MKQLQLLLLIAVFFAAGFLLGQSLQPQPTISSPLQQAARDADDVSLMFVFDEKNIEVVDMPWSENTTLFEATRETSHNEQWTFGYDDYGDLGILINEINAKKNGEDSHYWQYWVNNVQVQTAVNNYVLQKGDVVSWQFRESYD